MVNTEAPEEAYTPAEETGKETAQQAIAVRCGRYYKTGERERMGTRRGASPFFGGDVREAMDSMEAFLEGIMHKLMAKTPIWGIQRVGREEEVLGA